MRDASGRGARGARDGAGEAEKRRTGKRAVILGNVK